MDSRGRSSAARAAGALVIRRAVAPLVLHGVVDGAAWARAARADADAWRFFLRVDRCALPLSRALQREPRAAPADGPFRAILAAAVQREGARALVARLHLRTAAQIAASSGAALVALKGAILLAGDALDLSDVDLLARKDQLPALADALQARQWTPTPHTSHHVAQSWMAQGIALEVHTSLGSASAGSQAGLWERSEAMAAMAPLRQLDPRDHLVHVLWHVAIDHPNRRARLRDLALLAHAASRCTPADRTGPFLASGSDYAESMCRSTLEAATGQGDAAAAEQRALAMYALATRTPLRFLPPESRELVDAWSVSMLQTGRERQVIWEGARLEKFKPSGQPLIRAVEDVLTRVTPALGRTWRVSIRSTYYAATWTVARAIAARARRTVQGALTLIEHETN